MSQNNSMNDNNKQGEKSVDEMKNIIKMMTETFVNLLRNVNNNNRRTEQRIKIKVEMPIFKNDYKSNQSEFISDVVDYFEIKAILHDQLKFVIKYTFKGSSSFLVYLKLA